MKRRDFLRTVGATAAIGGLPTKAVASVGAAPVRYGMTPYAWAKYTARINKRLTPQMLTQFLGLSEGEAARMIRRLTFENVLAVPDARGVSRVSAEYAARADRRKAALRKMVQAIRERVLEDSEVGPEQVSGEMSDEPSDGQAG